MNRVLFVSILLALLSGMVSSASAQLGVDDGSYEEDSIGEYYGDEPAPRSASRGGGAASLEEARATRQGLRLGGGAGGRLAPRQVPDVYTVHRGDTLWDITGHFYGNPWQWPRVWSYNPEITNPHWIYPDDLVRLVPAGAHEVQLPSATNTTQAHVAAPSLVPGTIRLRDQGYLDEEALHASGEIVGAPEEHMLLTTFDDVYVRFDQDDHVRPGMDLTVFRRVDSDDRVARERGELVRIFGTIRLRSYDRESKIGRGTITEALDPIERGYSVANIPRQFDVVPPAQNATDVDAEVVATLRPIELVGDNQIVFVNVGREQGVALGNRFFVVRRGDDWNDSLEISATRIGARQEPNAPSEYPEEIVAEGRVVSVRPQSSALMVTRSVAEVVMGDHAEMRRGY